jgi:hypothetical protein
MTLRAFAIGVLLVAAFALLEPYSAHGHGWGGFGGSAFPGSPVLVLVVLSLGVNGIVRLVRRGWELKRPELMLVWCMVTVGVVYADSHGRHLYSMLACGPYMAGRPDLAWEEGGALTHAPEGLMLSKDPRSVAARQYYEGSGGRVPWRYWLRPLANWSAFFVLLALAVCCMAGTLRRQWVESERLMFPLARVPLEFTEESAGGGFLPRLFSEKGFRTGVLLTLAFRLFRALPLFFGGTSAMPLTIPMRQIFEGTPLAPMSFDDIEFWPQAVGFAFLVPADVSLSVWVFYWVARMELQTTGWLRMWEYGGTYGILMGWQQAGAYIAFTVGMLIMARQHLVTVVKKALWLGSADDSEEPVSYRVATWGLVLSLGGCLAWYLWHGMSMLGAIIALALVMCWYIVYARMVAQAGLYTGRTVWQLPNMVHGLSLGHALTGPGALIASMQDTMLVTGGSAFVAPMAINAFRISEVFPRRRRRLLLPVLMLAFIVALVCCSYSALVTAYEMGGLNMADSWAAVREPIWRYKAADNIIRGAPQYSRCYWGPLAIGLGSMSFMLFMRARFYWWPIHGIGLLTCSSWNAHRLWLPFLLGWLTKVSIMKYTGGRTLRSARYFFIALILVEATVGGISTIVQILSKGAVPGF